jgi:serine/threonine protein kinase/tetratricopeptide (TPR) repeat protein
MPCVNEQTVQDLVLGRLRGQALEGIEHHLAECSSCAALIALAASRTGSADPDAPPAPARGSKPSLAVGTIVGRFVVLEFLGAGGMGEVYAAYDPNLERKVAIKFLRPDVLGRGNQDVAAERMRREARLVAKLSHPNVVTVYEIDRFDDRLFIAMEHVDGQNVADWLKAEPRPARDVVQVFLAAGAGLAAAHAAGVIHRDFKPHNVMIAKGGEVRVMDFGLAHLDTEVQPLAVGAAQAEPPAGGGGTEDAAPASETSTEREARLTRTGALLGTPAYMAPEQLLGKKATARTDQYSFCVALHEALFGRRPSGAVGSRARISGKRAPISAKRTRITGKMQPLEAGAAARSVPGWIRRILKRGLAPDPAQRYASMDDLLADLRADKVKRRRIALVVLASLVIAGGGAWGAMHARVARQVRLCRANAATAAEVWPFESTTGEAIPVGSPTSVWQAFERSGAPDAAGIFGRVNHTLSTYLGEWSRRATDACEAANVRHEQSRDELALRMTCLEERLSAARALTGTLARADAKVVAHAADAALGLPDLDRCSNLVLLRSVSPPEGAAKRAEVERLRRRMGEIKLLVDTGHFESIGADVKTLEQDVRAAGYPPLLVDFLLFMHSNLENLGVPASRGEMVREALRVAEAAGYEEGIVGALLGVAWEEYRNPSVADLARDQAEAILRHIGDPLFLRAWFENNVQLTFYARGHLAEAVAHGERSLALKEQRTPRDARDIAISESNICLLLVSWGRPKQALPHCDRAVELSESAIGRQHPLSMNFLENRALTLVDLERFDEGCALAERVRAYFQAEDGRIEGRTTLMLALGRCAVRQGRPDSARDLLQRALAEATRTAATPMETAEIEWQLARAVYATGDHRRGVEIADRAARRYATLPELADRDREIRAWLAARRDRAR